VSTITVALVTIRTSLVVVMAYLASFHVSNLPPSEHTASLAGNPRKE
jgi:hypothetical protein